MMFAVDHYRYRSDKVLRYYRSDFDDALSLFEEILSSSSDLNDSCVILTKNYASGRYECRIRGDVKGFVPGSKNYEEALLSAYSKNKAATTQTVLI